MFSVNDVMVLEGSAEATPEDQVKSLQRAINDGVWGLQGSYGRAMNDALEAGDCMLGVKSSKDAYGNYIPSRTQVMPGSKGSREWVVQKHDEAWAVMLESV